ncbi:Asparagine synthetase [glutamine-hydrolyzing] 3 [Sporomusa silvacetica DSM 10669]|uniref:asparagine synthase (glutamine-hydrolyzing) n=1 Tax=Sporomusa silvacetica DSM 10669 TaxID=1123289 RepID=A0ABZ3ILD7_9FIRM|nr:asparagine synthase-related protein [Sporomusa silvacetica]OZC22988.1 asparagine synthetase 3 [Sporomusa silvacetica DSM 10669]
MSGIFGIVSRDGLAVSSVMLETMRQVMVEWGPDGCDIWLEGGVGLGQARFFNTPEAHYEHLPYVDTTTGLVFIATARLDNRDELLAACGIKKVDALTIGDGELLRQMYLRWGEECIKRVYGDWSFAVYHPVERKLFLARDHFGYTALYYYADQRVFAFASSRKALLALGLAPVEMDELYLAQVLVSWPDYHGERTIHKQLKRLPPAHCLSVTPERLDKHCYWRMEDTQELHLPRREDYIEAFREVFKEAVKARLRSEGKIGVSLSGGLDSGSVAAVAASLLRAENKRLIAYTSVPLTETSVYLGKHSFGNEFPLAQSTARQAKNIDLFPIVAKAISPIQAIRSMLAVRNEPAHAAGNFFWLQSIRETARYKGCHVLLNGQCGNASISWTGDVFSQSLLFQVGHFGWRRWIKEMAKRYAPLSLLQAYRRMHMPGKAVWQSSAIHPDFAYRLNLWEQMLESTNSLLFPKNTALDKRWLILKPGRSFVGAKNAENGAAFGIDVRDPTADIRVLTFTLSVPDRIFIDPETRVDRWLIREAMRGHLPDEVRLNRRFGQQSADLVPRLRICAAEVEAVLNELEDGFAVDYLNVPYMRQVWQMVQNQDTPEAFHKAGSILMRGIMAGLFVNEFYNNG